MKKKFRLWFNIVTICLCVCAIMVGVYAATNATLTINGQIGFQAHGCDVDASGYMYGYAVKDGQGNETGFVEKPTTTAQKEALALSTTNEKNSTPKVAEVRGSDVEGLTLGEQNFTDVNSNADGKPTDIVVVLTIKNQSLFDIYGVVSATSKDPNIGIKKSVGLFNLDKKVGETPDFIDITITLSVIPQANGSYDKITSTPDNVTISIDFNKGKVEDNLLKKDTTNNYYYVEMGTEDGTSNGTPLRWYAFAKDGATHSKSTALTTGSYYFISEKALLVDTEYNGKPWGPYPHSGKEDDNYSLDYGTSLINPLTNGQAEGSVYYTYGIAGSPIYNAITNRDLAGETYTKPNSTQGTTHDTYNQTLWLLARGDELKWLNGGTAVSDYTPTASLVASPVGGATSDYAYWWLRSPDGANSSGYADAWCVYDNGNVYGIDVYYTIPGVRPAFQINIAV